MNYSTTRGPSRFGQHESRVEVQLRKSTLVGGFFERMVASVKYNLRKTLGNARLSYEELLTVLVEVECMLNARPLTCEYNKVHGEVLTPSHLICGRRVKSLPDEITEPDDVVNEDQCSAQFKYLSTRLNHFWNRWRWEYLANPREFHRCKAQNRGRTVEVGDVVAVYEEEKKRGEWKIGVVESLVKGKDSIVRGAKVRVITKGKPTHLSSQFKSYTSWKLGVRGRDYLTWTTLCERLKIRQGPFR